MATACAGRGVVSGVSDFAGCGLGVLSGAGVAFFFFAVALLLPDLFLESAFFFPDFVLGEGAFEGLGVGRRLSVSSSSRSASLDRDLFDFAPELFGFGAGESSSLSGFGFDGVFDGFGVGFFFFFFGEAVGVGEGDFEWLLWVCFGFGESSSLT